MRVVNDVALVLKGHPEIAKLRIDLKAEGVPKSDAQKRADAVRDLLISQGVDGARLEAVGAAGSGSRVDFIITATAAPKPAAAATDAGGGAAAAPAPPATGAPPAAKPALPPAPPATPPPAPGATPGRP